jgi:hypothetical protein
MARQGIPHLYSTTTAKGNQTPSLSVEQFSDLINPGLVYLHNITEKTDGQSFKFGHDNQGFYTQTTGTDRVRDYYDHHKSDFHIAFGLFHQELQNNSNLLEYLKQTNLEVSGEMFSTRARIINDVNRTIKFANIEYSIDKLKLGHIGNFIIHTEMNKDVFANNIKVFSTPRLIIDCDVPNYNKTHISVDDIQESYYKLNLDLIKERTKPSNKVSKLVEVEKFNNIKKEVHNRIVNTIKLEPKWGDTTEGWVVHPSVNNPNAPRFKIITDEFKQAKEFYNGR